MSAKVLNVLHVEDNSDDLVLTQRAFARLGAKVKIHMAFDGQDAVEGLMEAQRKPEGFHIPDFILLDLSLPRQNGFEFLQWFKQQEPFQKIPIFILTGSNHALDRQRAEELGASAFFQKPVHPLALDPILSEILSKVPQQ